jgi:2-hydroxy-6-oxonona-2,4-dienedioate hydrolase/2-succinyl-6-hydroxy-2,4-cyclohexadiene-1-carboxylate synthase
MPIASVNGIRLHYQQLGQGPNIVMIHGITGNLAIWHLNIVPALMNEARITTYDLRGHGYSDMPPSGYSTADMASDLGHLLDTLGIERTHIVGHSFGADVALHFAMLHPERVDRLVLAEPAIAALQHLREPEDWPGWGYWRSRLEDAGVEVPKEKSQDIVFLLKSSVKIPKLFGFAKGRERRSAPLLRLMQTTTAAYDYRTLAGLTLEKIDQIQTPVLLVYGEDSVFLGTYEYLRDHLPNCRPILMPASEHFAPLERPEVFVGHLREFLFAEQIGDAGDVPPSPPNG